MASLHCTVPLTGLERVWAVSYTDQFQFLPCCIKSFILSDRVRQNSELGDGRMQGETVNIWARFLSVIKKINETNKMYLALLEEVGLTSRHLFRSTAELRGVYRVFNKFVKGISVSGE